MPGEDSVLEELWSPVAALTAADAESASGLITSTAVTASLLPESPRIAVLLGLGSWTCELVLASCAFALHLLPAEPVQRSLELFRTLGFRSGREWTRWDGGAGSCDDPQPQAARSVAANALPPSRHIGGA